LEDDGAADTSVKRTLVHHSIRPLDIPSHQDRRMPVKQEARSGRLRFKRKTLDTICQWLRRLFIAEEPKARWLAEHIKIRVPKCSSEARHSSVSNIVAVRSNETVMRMLTTHTYLYVN